MDGRTADGAGDSDPRTTSARDELLRALIAERFDRPPFGGRTRSALIAQRRRILLGRDLRHG